VPEVHAGESRLPQVLQTLNENGIKYRRDWVKPRLEVSAERRIGVWVFLV
jgi:light-regulated signal transduction histidine kinase (bacteriophytochrome)